MSDRAKARGLQDRVSPRPRPSQSVMLVAPLESQVYEQEDVDGEERENV